jgi:anti-sigma regulatory factor (Ser/Thr protein kinase)
MAGVARRFVAEALAEWDGSHDPSVAVLLTHELVANAIVHARTAVTLVIRFDAPLLTIEVHDESEKLPRPRHPDRREEHGRGLEFVAQLADDWGFREKDGGGKVVWFDLIPAAKS